MNNYSLSNAPNYRNTRHDKRWRTLLFTFFITKLINCWLHCIKWIIRPYFKYSIPIQCHTTRFTGDPRYMSVRLAKYLMSTATCLSPLHQQHENWHNNEWYFRLSKSQRGMKYLPITSILHDTKCIECIHYYVTQT